MLNENIKAIRKSKGLSQEDLAVRLNVVRQTISKWETGHHTLNNIETAHAYNMTQIVKFQ